MAVTVVTQTRDGKIWVGTESGGLSLMDPEARGVFTHYRHDPEDPATLSSNNIGTLLPAKLGMLWVGTEEGLDRDLIGICAGRSERNARGASADDHL